MNAEQPTLLEHGLLTAPEVGELLRIPASTVYELARRGSLPCMHIGRAVRFCQPDLELFLATQRQPVALRGA